MIRLVSGRRAGLLISLSSAPSSGRSISKATIPFLPTSSRRSITTAPSRAPTTTPTPPRPDRPAWRRRRGIETRPPSDPVSPRHPDRPTGLQMPIQTDRDTLLLTFLEGPSDFNPSDRDRYLQIFSRCESSTDFLHACDAVGIRVWDPAEATKLLQIAIVGLDDAFRTEAMVRHCARMGHRDCVLVVAARQLAAAWDPSSIDPVVLKYLRELGRSGTVPVADVLLGSYEVLKRNWAGAEMLFKSAIESFVEHDMACLRFLNLSVWTQLGSVLGCAGPDRADEAYATLNRAAVEEGNPVAMYLLGRMIADFEVSPPERYPVEDCNYEWFEFTTQAASAGDPKAAFALGVFYLEAKPDHFASVAAVDAALERTPRAPPTIGQRVVEWWADVVEERKVTMSSILAEPGRYAPLSQRIGWLLDRSGRLGRFSTFAQHQFGEDWVLAAAKASYPPAIRYLAGRMADGHAFGDYSAVLMDSLQEMREEIRTFYRRDFDHAVRLIGV